MIPKTIVDLDEVFYHSPQLGKTYIIPKPEPVILQNPKPGFNLRIILRGLISGKELLDPQIPKKLFCCLRRTRSFVLSQFSDVRARAIREYVRFVRDRMTMGHREDLYQLRDQRILGGEDFRERVVEGRKDGSSYIYDLSIQELVDGVSLVFDISVDKICSRSRGGEGAWG